MAANILVTGGAGFIGSHVCKALAEIGLTPVTYDNLSNGHEWAVRWGPFVHGDVRDGEQLGTTMAHYRPQAVMHFAALIEAGHSVISPEPFYENNVGGLLTLLSEMKTHAIDHIVFSSTAAVYGMPASVPIKEDQPFAPVNPYGATKRACEGILRDYAAAYGINSVSLRYFNAAGADPDGDIGEAHHPETHLIPLILDAAAGCRKNITIFGTDYPTRDGTCVRDYVHVSDIASAHVRALEYAKRQSGAHAYNLGNGKGFTVREVIDSARAVTHRRIEINLDARRPGDPPELVADYSRAQNDLGWQPQFADLQTQIAHAWAWRSSGSNHFERAYAGVRSA